MGTLCQRFGLKPKEFSQEFWSTISNYKWPGNVRELIQALEKALLAAKEEPILYPLHLPTYIRIQVARNGVEKKPDLPGKDGDRPGGHRGPALVERSSHGRRSGGGKAIFAGPDRLVAGNIDEACRISGLSRSRLYTLLRKHQLSAKLPPQEPRPDHAPAGDLA